MQRRTSHGVRLSGLLLLSVAFLLAPASASPLAAPIVLKAPYKGTTVNLFSSLTKTGCSKLVSVRAATFSPHTGVGRLGGIVSAPPCRTFGGNQAVVTEEFDAYVPIKAPHGPRTIVANWTFVAAGTENLTRGHCAPSKASQYYCFQSSLVLLYAGVDLYDVTNSTFLAYSTNSWSGIHYLSRDDTDCPTGIGSGCVNTSTGANASFSTTAQFSWWVNATLVSGHTYLLVLGTWGGVFATLEYFNTVLTGGHASASLDMASLGRGATLNSITIS